MALTTTWTQQDTVAFTAGTLATISDCVSEVGATIHRGTLSASTSPTETQVQNWLIRAKQELSEMYGFTWRRAYKYADTVAGTWCYALPADYAGGGSVNRLRNLTDDELVTFVDPATFDAEYPDPAGSSNGAVDYYTIKDRELWLSCPANGVVRLELEYNRSGDDTSATDISYLPEIMRFKIIDFAVYRSYLHLQMWDAANIFKAEWGMGVQQSKKGDGSKKWASMGYMCRNWQYES